VKVSDASGTVVVMFTLHCPTCHEQRPVDQPPCAEHHVDCPEWVCTDCDTVIVVGWLVTDAPRPSRQLVNAA
jgi:hypothetical protein